MVELAQRSVGRKRPNVFATRKGTILIAVLCALVAAGILVYALNKYRQNVNNANRPETVFVASSLIQKGTAGNAIAAEQLVRPTTIGAKQVTAGAIADAAEVNGKVAATDIYPGQQVTLADFVPAAGVGASLAPNQRAIEVPISSAAGLAGNLAAGDYVDVYVSLGGNNNVGTSELRLLAANVQVLQAPGGGGGAGLGANQQTGNLALAVDDNLAPKLMFASDNGKLWLALRPGNASNPSPKQAVTIGSITSGKAPVEPSGR